LNAQKTGADIVIWPVHKWDERLNVDIEVEMPPANIFIELGFSPTRDVKNKHYRRFYAQELEKTEEIMPTCPFMYQNIFRMETKSTGLFSKSDNPADNKSVIAGQFKGKIKVYNTERL